MLFKVTEDVLDPRELERLLDRPENGAVVTFQGVVRNHSRGKIVSYLEYDAYAPMATKVMAQIAEEIKAKWPVTDVAIWHRIGRLEIGEASLLVVVTAGHRREAFEACHHTVDRIKEIVPVWKKEVWEDGESWIEGDVMVATGHHHEDDDPVATSGANHTPAPPASVWEMGPIMQKWSDSRGRAIDRLEALRDEYNQRYPGKWIAVTENEVFGPADSYGELAQILKCRPRVAPEDYTPEQILQLRSLPSPQ